MEKISISKFEDLISEFNNIFTDYQLIPYFNSHEMKVCLNVKVGITEKTLGIIKPSDFFILFSHVIYRISAKCFLPERVSDLKEYQEEIYNYFRTFQTKINTNDNFGVIERLLL